MCVCVCQLKKRKFQIKIMCLYIYMAIKKERNSAICNMDGPLELEGIMPSEMSQTETEKYYMMQLIRGM